MHTELEQGYFKSLSPSVSPQKLTEPSLLRPEVKCYCLEDVRLTNMPPRLAASVEAWVPHGLRTAAASRIVVCPVQEGNKLSQRGCKNVAGASETTGSVPKVRAPGLWYGHS